MMTTRLIADLSGRTGLSRSDVERIVASAPHRYKTYEIPKRSGRGSRTIAQPSREVKGLQRIALGRLVAALPVHDAAHGYVKGRGIKTNAQMHKDGAYQLKIDFLNFFPSIKPHDLSAHIAKYAPHEFDDQELGQLATLFFWNPKGNGGLRLSIGSPASPFLSNTIMYDVDVSISNLASDAGVTYTRYADDLTFSTTEPHPLHGFVERVRERCSALAYPALRINRAKTVFASKKGRRVVTGLVVTNSGAISLGRVRKRWIRTMVHKRANNQLDPDEMLRLEGYLSFANDVEPGFVVGLHRKYRF